MLEYEVKDMGEGQKREEIKEPEQKEMRWKRKNRGGERSRRV